MEVTGHPHPGQDGQVYAVLVPPDGLQFLLRDPQLVFEVRDYVQRVSETAFEVLPR